MPQPTPRFLQRPAVRRGVKAKPQCGFGGLSIPFLEGQEGPEGIPCCLSGSTVVPGVSARTPSPQVWRGAVLGAAPWAQGAAPQRRRRERSPLRPRVKRGCGTGQPAGTPLRSPGRFGCPRSPRAPHEVETFCHQHPALRGGVGSAPGGTGCPSRRRVPVGTEQPPAGGGKPRPRLAPGSGDDGAAGTGTPVPVTVRDTTSGSPPSPAPRPPLKEQGWVSASSPSGGCDRSGGLSPALWGPAALTGSSARRSPAATGHFPFWHAPSCFFPWK